MRRGACSRETRATPMRDGNGAGEYDNDPSWATYNCHVIRHDDDITTLAHGANDCFCGYLGNAPVLIFDDPSVLSLYVMAAKI